MGGLPQIISPFWQGGDGTFTQRENERAKTTPIFCSLFSLGVQLMQISKDRYLFLVVTDKYVSTILIKDLEVYYSVLSLILLPFCYK